MLNTQEQFFKQIEKCEQPLIVFSADWNGDAVASALALFLFLKKLNKKVEIVAEASAKSNIWSFLPGRSEIKNSLNGLRKFIISLDTSKTIGTRIKYAALDKKINFIISSDDGLFKPEDVSFLDSGFKYDLIITIGAADLESLGQIYNTNVDFFYKTNVINIDCQSSNEEFGQINLIDINSAANAETLFYLMQEKSAGLITEDIATCLLAGIIAGTKNFRLASLTPRTLLTASKLVSLGGRREEIIEKLYQSRNFKTLKLWGRVLNNLNTLLNGQIVWSMIKRDDFKTAEALEDSLLEIIDELIVNIPEAKIITILFENPENNKNKILLYSVKNANALDMLKEYKSQGNTKTAQAELEGNIEEIKEKYLKELENKLKNFLK